MDDPKLNETFKIAGDAARIILGLSATIRAYRTLRRWIKRQSDRGDP